MIFFGTQPTFKHVPPNPHDFPCTEGFTKSIRAIDKPNFFAVLAKLIPAVPPPKTIASYYYFNGLYGNLDYVNDFTNGYKFFILNLYFNMN